MENRLLNLLQQLKEPTLKFDLQPVLDASPSLRSYVGGKPYMTKDEKYPCCEKCKRSLNFIFQLYIPKNENYTLYCFYYCLHCDTEMGESHFEMKVYTNPTLKDMKQKMKKNPYIEYHEFVFEPAWSLPEWDVLHDLKPDIVDHLTKKYKDDAWLYYENNRESLVGTLPTDPLFFYKGYPQFLTEPFFPTCPCCKEKMTLWLQLDSFEEYGLSWADSMGCLFIFKCPKDNDHFDAYIQ